MNTCANGTQCWISAVVLGLAWLLASSAMLFLTWNKVVAYLTKLKTVKYWQALLFVATICSFCAPRYYLMKRHSCGSSHGHCQKRAHNGECPYSRGEGDKDDDHDEAAEQPKK